MVSFNLPKLFVFIIAKFAVITSSFVIDSRETVKHFALLDLASNIIQNVDVSSKTLLIMDMGKTLHLHGLVEEAPKLIYTSDIARIPSTSKFVACMETSSEFKPTLTVVVVEAPDAKVTRLLQNNYYSETLMLVYLVNADDGKDLLKSLGHFCCPRKLQILLIAYWSNELESLQWFTYNVFKNLLSNRTGQYEFGTLISDTSKDLHGFDMRSCMIDDPPYTELEKNGDDYIAGGLEGVVFNAIVRSLNVSNRLVEPLSKNLSLLASYIYYAEHGLCDVIFTKSITPFPLNKMENMLHTLEFDDWCVLVPVGTQLTGFYNLLMPFQPAVWYIVIVTSLSLFLVWNLSTKILKRLDYVVDRRISNLDVLGLVLNISLHVDFHRLTSNTKTFVLSASLYAFLMTYFYQSILVSALLRPVYHENMHTLKDVEASRLPIFAYSEELHYWQVSKYSENASKDFIDLLVGQLSREMFYNFMVTKSRTVGYLLPSSLIELIALGQLDENGLPLYHKVEECVHPMMYTFSSSCDFPFGRRVEELYDRLIESGLRARWKRDREKIFTVNKFEESGAPRTIGLIDLIGSLFIWNTGIVLSILCFIFEVIYDKYCIG